MVAREYVLQSDVSWARTLGELEAEMGRWDIRDWAVAPAQVPYKDATAKMNSGEAAVQISWTHPDGRRGAMMIDHFETLRENFRVAYMNVRDMRMIEKRGGQQAMAAAYLMLGAGDVPAQRDPHEVLGVRPDSPWEVIKAAHKALARSTHPDQGGDAKLFEEVQGAFETITYDREATQ